MSDQNPRPSKVDIEALQQIVVSGQKTPEEAIAAMVPEWDQDLAALIVFGWVGKHSHIIDLDAPEQD